MTAVSAPRNHGRPGSGDTQPIPVVRSGPPSDRPLPDRPPPIQFTADPPPPGDNPALTWLLRGLGLLAVAVISGLVWWYINNDSPQAGPQSEPTSQPSAGEFQFTAHQQVPNPLHDSNCADHAYDKVQKFFQKTPCQQLSRALYTTTDREGRTVYTNVSVVRMSTDAEAAELRELTDANGTGNVSDLVREGIVKLPPLTSLSDGYEAVQRDRNVIIVESDFDPAAKKGDKAQDGATLDAICRDAIRLGEEISTT